MATSTAKTETNIESEFVKVLVYVIRDDGNYGGWKTELLVEEITNKIEAKFLLCSYCKGMLRDACLFEKDGKQELACSVCLPKDFVKQIARLNAETINEKQVSTRVYIQFHSSSQTVKFSIILEISSFT